MIENLYNSTILAFMIGMVAYVYSCILTAGGEIFFNWYKFLQRNLEENHPMWFKVLVDCEKCVAGQLALWFQLYFMIFNLVSFKQDTDYQYLYSLQWFIPFTYTIAVAIFFTQLIKRINRWIKN